MLGTAVYAVRRHAGRIGRYVVAFAAVIAVLGAWAWHRTQRFDMQATLASFARNERTRDAPWDQQERKIATLKRDLAHERDPVQHLIIQREIAQQYV